MQKPDASKQRTNKPQKKLLTIFNSQVKYKQISLQNRNFKYKKYKTTDFIYHFIQQVVSSNYQRDCFLRERKKHKTCSISF